MFDEPVYKFHLPEKKNGDRKAYAAVLEFDSDDAERIQQFLATLHTRGITRKEAIVRSYDPAFTTAELYFP